MGENLVLGLFLAIMFLTAASLYLLRRAIRKRQTHANLALLVLGNLLLFVLFVSALALSGELYYRFIYDTTDSLMHTKVSERWFLRYWHNNPDRLRDDIECIRAIKPGKRRVTFIGDSFTAGHGIKNIRDRFVNIVRRNHPNWELHMLAVPGADTGNELASMKACLANEYQLDEVVLVYCLNDVSDMMPERDEALKKIYADDARAGWLRRNSYLFNTLYHRISARRDPFFRNYFGFVRDGYNGPLWERQKARLAQYRDLIQSHGGRLSVVTFPFLQALGKDYEYEAAHIALDRFWHDQQVPHLDLLTVFRELPPRTLTVNSQDPHPNEHAHALAAPVIDRFVSEQMKTPRAL